MGLPAIPFLPFPLVPPFPPFPGQPRPAEFAASFLGFTDGRRPSGLCDVSRSSLKSKSWEVQRSSFAAVKYKVNNWDEQFIECT